MFEFSLCQLLGIAITVGYLGYLAYLIIIDNRFTNRLPIKPIPNPYLEDVPEEDHEGEERPSEVLPLTHDFSCYDCMKYHFQRRFCMAERPSAKY